jgi:hypothetical protein
MIAAHEFEDADYELTRIQTMAPDFIPAYTERARLAERRGALEEAERQWSAAAARTEDPELQQEAKVELMRLGRMREAKAEAMKPAPAPPPKKKPSRLEKRIRITSVGREKYQGNDEFDEMRLIRINLTPDPGKPAPVAKDVRVSVTFVDREQDTGRIGVTRVVAPKAPLNVSGDWSAREARTLTAAYVVPTGFRAREEREYGERRGYYGYLVRVHYQDKLQDVAARPATLIKELSAEKAVRN